MNSWRKLSAINRLMFLVPFILSNPYIEHYFGMARAFLWISMTLVCVCAIHHFCIHSRIDMNGFSRRTQTTTHRAHKRSRTRSHILHSIYNACARLRYVHLHSAQWKFLTRPHQTHPVDPPWSGWRVCDAHVQTALNHAKSSIARMIDTHSLRLLKDCDMYGLTENNNNTHARNCVDEIQ